MKDRIYIKHWQALKSDNYSGKTDLYYLKVANKNKSNFTPASEFMLSQFIQKDDIIMFCCFLTAYFEDIISETNIWQTFKELHKDIYNKKVPFYTTDANYIDDEINFEDVAILTWYFLNTSQDKRFISPFNDFIVDIAKTTMEVLEEEYEYAPVNKALKNLYTFEGKPDDFYELRAFIQFVFFDSYLFFSDVKQELEFDILKTLEDKENEDPEQLMGYVREITEHFTFNRTSTLLALKAKDWTQALLEKSHQKNDSISTISRKISDLFLYKKQNETSVFLEHIASGMPFEITKKSFDYYNELKQDDIVFIGLVKYNNEWWFSGSFHVQEFDADLILDLKNSADRRTEVNFLNDPSEVRDIMSKQEKAFLGFNNQSHIAYMNSQAVETFTKNFMTHYNGSLNLSEKEHNEAVQRARDEGFFGSNESFEAINTEDDNAIVFFNPKKGIEIYLDVAHIFPDKNNPFFIEEGNDDIMELLISQEYSTEFTYYYINTFKDELSIFKKEPYKSYLKNIDFLLRFWKKENYETESLISITGKNNLSST